MLVIIGGSGMLFAASQTLTEHSQTQVLLCGRQQARYQAILTAFDHAEFFPFDFSQAESYTALAEKLNQQTRPISLLAWIHSPYYPHLLKLLDEIKPLLKKAYLVKGSNSNPLPEALISDFPLTVIQLGKHTSENRWLTHQEISQQVLETVEGEQAV
ncbi:short chain dehydrogenase [Kingella potus]|uniref:Short chain dehydrogenase n=1 Tax=Kingella potus TaxID=265175 RepID=A0A377R2Z2_9NEIS|nr:hypothetical protein [Kingella potus]UOO99975.1 hypothetical protein LVJ84_08060 [Kingella potus]STR03260.1 short chain dehydrogenase [Kingella potus]